MLQRGALASGTAAARAGRTQVVGDSCSRRRGLLAALVHFAGYERNTKMAENDNSDHYQTLAQQIFGKAMAAVVSEAKTRLALVRESSGGESSEPTAASESSEPAAASIAPTERLAHQKQLATAAELAKMIEIDLARHPDCPKAGFRVTVYGSQHWRAMLTISPAAGRVRNPQELRDLTDELAERLRKRYDVA